MRNTLNKLLDTLFPARETQLTIRTYNPKQRYLQPGCYEGIFYCSYYSQPLIQAAILESKYQHNGSAQAILAQLLTDWVHNKQLADVCFVPIPLGKNRHRARGHNQVLSVLQQTNYSYQGNLLVRTQETTPQVSLDRQHRLQNIKNVFACNLQEVKKLTAQTVILLDDVVTTGATLKEARATLAPHLPPQTKLICLALAH